MQKLTHDPRQILKSTFGYDQFRPMQEQIISAVLAGRDVQVLMPTGGGKSLCFQVPALSMEGMCIVVSPLISLMKDQVESLRANGVAAAFLNSSQSAVEQSTAERQAHAGQLKLLYVSPEKLMTPGFLQQLHRLRINLFAIDEAHCISSWGHDFRPEYAQLRILKQEFPQVPVIALTATADKLTRKDIAQQLDLRTPVLFVSSFDRPNLSLEVRPAVKRVEDLLRFLKTQGNNSGIIYCLSRDATETLAKKLQQQGIGALPYHAGLSADERAATQEAFIKDDVRIVCATIAFGMGIDKSNVRFVVHYNLPKNMEGYYQEIGRAGRDGLPSRTILYYTYADVMKLRNFLDKPELGARNELGFAKLERMQQYAEAQSCRRQILLQYFSETLPAPCGNCDVCLNPRTTFNGTELAQKALSAVARTREKVGLNLLIDILRGSRNRSIIQLGYDQIKTYGAGSDLSFLDWRQYLQQLINLGLLDIAYDDHYNLKLTEKSWEVLQGKRTVELVKPVSPNEQMPAEKAVKKKEAKEPVTGDPLFEHLRKVRKKLADARGVPPYVVFSDATLQEMVRQRPANKLMMMAVSGVGEQKFASFGEAFINAILEFENGSTSAGTEVQEPLVRLPTKELTWQSLQEGMSPDEIAVYRHLQPATVYAHLAELYRQGYDVKLSKWLSEAEYQQVRETMATIGSKATVREVHAELQQQLSPEKIRLAIARAAKEGRT